MEYGDILYEKRGGTAWLTINRPEVYFSALELFYTTPEAIEGMDGFKEKRKPDWSQFRKNR